MSSTQVRSETAIDATRARTVDMKLEVVVIPVSDVDRAKRFYKTLGHSDTPAAGRATGGMPPHGREPRARGISSSSPESALRARLSAE